MVKRDAIISQHFGTAKWQHGLPIMALLFSSAMWGLSWYPLRYLENSGIHGLWVSLLIYAGTLVVALPWIIKHRYEFKQHAKPLIIIAIAVGWLNISFILAVIEGQIVRVTLLFFLSPVWAAFLSWLVLKEDLRGREWKMIAIAIIGAMIMLWSPEVGLPIPQNKADWLALSSGICFAFANMMIRKTEKASIVVKTISGWIGVVVVSGFLVLLTMTPPGDLNVFNVTMALLCGLFGMTLMTVAVVYGVSNMPLHRSSVILLFEIVVGAASAVWLANESIIPQEWIGGSLVILAAYISARLEIKEE